jgi:glyoxylase-like metal-dependent hydrolase (beta-lactamase superfamily II)
MKGDMRGTVRRVVEAILMRVLTSLALAALLLAAGGALLSRACAGAVSPPVAVAPGIAAEKGGGAWLYAIRLPAGVALVDAGRDPKGRPIDAALSGIGARRPDVTDVLLTHGHPAETVGLAALRQARVHAGAGDVDVITGRERAGRGVDRLAGLFLPRTIARVDEAIAAERELDVGGERVLAIPVPGHSLGSTAYLVRTVLFVGDAASLQGGRLVPGPRFMSTDPRLAEHALRHLARRLAGAEVSRVCTGHDGCSPEGAGTALLESAAGRRPLQRIP